MNITERITKRVDVSAIWRLLERFSCHFERMPNKEELNDLIYNVENRYYTQIIYRFAPEYIAIIIAYFEGREQYEVCGKISGQIKEYCKLNGEDIPTKLLPC